MSAYTRVRQIKHQLTLLHARSADAAELIECGQRLKAEVAVEIEVAELELADAVAAPAEGNTDPTAWLPNELMILILLQVVSLEGCRFVCKRWNKLCRDRQMKSAVELWRWQAYARGTRSPRRLKGHRNTVFALAVGKCGRVYSASRDKTVKVWSGSTGDLLQTLQGHTGSVYAIAVGDDGNVYSGSYDCTVRVWSGEDGRLVRKIEHRSYALSLAVDKTHLYSGTADSTIRVWLCSTGECVQTLSGHEFSVRALVLDNRGKLYSGSYDNTIRVWSLPEHTHLRTLTGHKDCVTALAVRLDGTLFSGSFDSSIRMWSSIDGAYLRTLHGHTDAVCCLAFARDGALLSGGAESADGLWRWLPNDWTGQIMKDSGNHVEGLAVGSRGQVYSSSRSDVLLWT